MFAWFPRLTIPEKNKGLFVVYSKGTGHNKFVRRGPTLSGIGGFIEYTTCLMNTTNKILLALKFELTQKYSASKSQHQLDIQEK